MATTTIRAEDPLRPLAEAQTEMPPLSRSVSEDTRNSLEKLTTTLRTTAESLAVPPATHLQHPSSADLEHSSLETGHALNSHAQAVLAGDGCFISASKAESEKRKLLETLDMLSELAALPNPDLQTEVGKLIDKCLCSLIPFIKVDRSN